MTGHNGMVQGVKGGISPLWAHKTIGKMNTSGTLQIFFVSFLSDLTGNRPVRPEGALPYLGSGTRIRN